MFSSIDDVIERFKQNNYIASRRIATVMYLANELGKAHPGRRPSRSREDRPRQVAAPRSDGT